MNSFAFQLRPWVTSDLDSLVKYANNPNIARFLTDGFPHPYTEKDGLSFIEMASMGDPTHIFAIEINNEACGGIGLHLQTDIMKKNAELGYWLAEPFWGKGIITQAVKEIVRIGFEQFPIDRIYARPFGKNVASQKVLEKSGFILEARFHNTIWKNEEADDELIYAVRRNT